MWQAWNFQDILKSKTPFCVTSAGHRALFIRGRRGTFWSFCTLLKRWQALVKMRCGFGGHFEWQAPYFLDLCQKVPKTQVKSRFWHWAMFIFRGTGNGFVLWKSNMCSRKPLVILGLSYRSLCGAVRIWDRSCNPLGTFCLSDRSRCGMVWILRSLPQLSRQFGPVRSLSLWCGAHFEIARASFLALWACQIALAVARCFFDSQGGLSHIFMTRRSFIESLRRDLATKEILPRGLFQRSCQSCPESSYRELLQRSHKEILPTDLL